MAELKSLIVNGVSRLNSTAYAKNVYADKIIINSGTSSQFLKADGSLDSTAYSPTSHTHSYLPLSGGTLTGTLTIASTSSGNYNEGLRITTASNSWAGITFGSTGTSGAPTNGWFVARNPNNKFIISPADSSDTTGLTLNSGGNALWRNNILIHAGNYTSYVNTTNFSGLNKTGTVTSVAVSNGGGLSISGSPITTSGTITISHSNSVTAQATQALYPIKIDANGHISAYGTAVTSLPASDVYAWAKASTKPSYTLDEVSDGSSRKLANYLPLAGGTMTGAAPITFTENKVCLNFRNNSTYYSKVEYMTSGNEALVFGNTAAVTSFIFANGLNLTDRSDYQNLGTVAMQIKSNKVSINRAVRPDTDPQTETLYIGGTTRVASNDFYVGTASGSQCHQQYDSTTKCLKFVFD